jgi:hypothetical protein
LAERLKQRKPERLLEEMQTTARSDKAAGEDAVTLLRRQRLHPDLGGSGPGIHSGRIRMLVRSLWIYEVGNVLALKHPDLAEPQLSRLRRMQIPEISLDEATVQHALRLVTMKKAGFYDAAYHATAIVQRGLLVMADKKSLQTVAMMPM